jgi:hypothetical protein
MSHSEASSRGGFLGRKPNPACFLNFAKRFIRFAVLTRRDFIAHKSVRNGVRVSLPRPTLSQGQERVRKLCCIIRKDAYGGRDIRAYAELRIGDEKCCVNPATNRSVEWEFKLAEDKVNFDGAVKEFRALLEKNGYVGEILWVAPGDVLWTGKRLIYVRVPTAEDNLAKARETYESGIARGSGVLFSTVCELDGVVCCCAWAPERYEDGPQGLWSHGLKMMAKTEESRIRGKAVRSALWWWCLGWTLRKKQSLKEFLLH